MGRRPDQLPGEAVSWRKTDLKTMLNKTGKGGSSEPEKGCSLVIHW